MKIFARTIAAAGLIMSLAAPVFAASHLQPAQLSCADFAALDADAQIAALLVLTEMIAKMATDEMASDAMAADDAMASDDQAMPSDDATGLHHLRAVLSTCAANPDMMVLEAVELG